jgi:hypothetical protein
MTYRIARWIGLVSLPLVLLLAIATQVYAADPVTLELQAPTKVGLGDQVTVSALLRDAQGSPVRGSRVVFWMPASFLSNSGAVELGSAVTDSRGIATIVYQARIGGAVSLNAYLSGDSRYDAAYASADMQVEGTAQLTKHIIEGVRVPGLGVWLLAGLLGIVYSIYLTVVVLLSLIAREGSQTPKAAGGADA